MTKQKKPKTGDVVGWMVVGESGGVVDWYATRIEARYRVLEEGSSNGRKYRIAKIVLAK